MTEYIDFYKIKRILDEYVSDTQEHSEYTCGHDDCFAWVQDVSSGNPTIDARELKHGRWLRISPSSKGYRRICSECKQIAIMIRKEYKYCPNCGAKMGVDEND